MYRVCGLRLGSKFGMQLAMAKIFILRLTVKEMGAFAIFTEKYSRPYGWSGSNFTAVANYTIPESRV